jgi:hypothetical protein
VWTTIKPNQESLVADVNWHLAWEEPNLKLPVTPSTMLKKPHIIHACSNVSLCCKFNQKIWCLYWYYIKEEGFWVLFYFKKSNTFFLKLFYINFTNNKDFKITGTYKIKLRLQDYFHKPNELGSQVSNLTFKNCLRLLLAMPLYSSPL